MSSLSDPTTTDSEQLVNLGLNTSTVSIAELTFIELYANYIISYAVGVISGIAISTMIGVCCYQRNKSRKNGNIGGTVRRRNMDRQQVQLLIHRRLPFDGTGSNCFTIRQSILHSSDWDEEATLQANFRESQAIQQQGLLYSSGSIDNLASKLRSEPMSSTQTNVAMPTTVTNYASVNFTQYSTPISTELSKNCKKVKIEINNECSDNPSHLKHKSSEVTNERLDNPNHLKHKSSEVTNERLGNPNHLKHKTTEVTNERLDNPNHLKHETTEVTNEYSDNPNHLKHETTEVTNEYSDNPSHLKHKTGEVTNQPSINNEKSQTALNHEEPKNITFISASVSGRKHYTKVNKILNSDHKAHTLQSPDNFPRSAYERMNKAKTLNKCLQIKLEDDSKCCRSHSLVEFVPNSPDRVKIDGKIWHTKSNE